MGRFVEGAFGSSASTLPAAKAKIATRLKARMKNSGFFGLDELKVRKLMEFIISIGRARLCQPRVKQL